MTLSISLEYQLMLHHHYTNNQLGEKFIESANQIAKVAPDEIFYPRKLLINAFIHYETVFAQAYRHLIKGGEKIVWHKSFSK